MWPSAEPLELVCFICDKHFDDRIKYGKHMTYHNAHGKYPCDQCDSAFPSPSELKRHMRVHSGK